MNKVKWTNPANTSNAMTWYRTTFSTPDISMFGIVMDENDNILSQISGSFLLDIGNNQKGFQRGHFWLNGIDMGHYNSVIQQPSDGTIVMSQRYYYIPIDYLAPYGSTNSQNVLIFEEELCLDDAGVNNFDYVNLVYSTVVIP